jgi:uncharacterized protein (UPF0335 family)
MAGPAAKATEDFDFSDDALEGGIAGIGDNGGPDLSEFEGTEVDPNAPLNPTAKGQLQQFIERLERLHEDRQAVMNDIKEVMAEAKGNGFDTKIIRNVLKIRGQDAAKRAEEEALTDLYLAALVQEVSEAFGV